VRDFWLAMPAGGAVFLAEFALWCGLVLAAPVMTAWALIRSSKQRTVAVIALCVWCTLAGATLMGAMWGWMATENERFQLRKIAALPPGAKPADVDLGPMGSVLFFTELDRFGRRLSYLLVLLPLVATALIVRKTLVASPSEKQSSHGLESEVFTPHDL
jgi:hypothetical protein